ncbi:MAG: citrate/2-methylcitrate synthase [Desulfobacterales bacterium]|nr:citrate/2-methylcitrate synthase [Desulfobacterales bacterium]
MADSKEIINTGLRGVTVASTKICHVDSENSKLIYRGYLITDLAEKATYEEVVYLLLYEKLPNPEELKQFRQELAKNRPITDEVIAALKTRPKTSLPMDILQAAVPMLANHDPNPDELKIENAGRIATRLIAQFETIVAAWHRIRQDQEPVAPDPDLSHAGNFLYMMSGEKPDEDMTHFMDTCLVLHAEHSFNASTFSARQVCSTHAHMYAAVAAAVGSLSGELHGGANARVMQMLKEIGSIDAIDDYVRKKLDSGGKIMGLGHAVYKNGDPRAAILAPMSKRMGEKVNNTKWYELSDALEKKGKEVFKEKKGADIFANVDFYSASLYYAMGIPIDLFTPVFAISRIAGWAAHVIEEQFAGAAPKPVLYRPASEYIGEYCGPEECAFVPMEERN